uniref:DUF7788 domain-containing protein n=1 Tax=viral metagenome TaxID=1070528 RepID=A0A6C0LAJ4_9ZZZZ
MDIEEFPYLNTTDLSYHFQEQIVYLYLNIMRKTNDFVVKELASQFRELLLLLKQEMVKHRCSGLFHDGFKYNQYIDLAYRLVAHTRDIVGGKGEHELFYMLVYELHRVFPTLSIYLLHNYIGVYKVGSSLGNNIDCKLGCWRDVKYLCNYVRNVSPKGSDDSIIDICIELMNNQLKKDIESWRFSVNAGSRKHISNIAKWIPREKRRFNWLFEKLAVHWCNNYGRWKLDSDNYNYYSALTKCKRQYRKVIARMNKILDTTEIKQCYQLWDDINVDNVSKYTVMKQSKLFLCYGNKDEITDVLDFFKDVSKRSCSQKYIERSVPIKSSYSHNEIIQLPISYFVKEAMHILRSCNTNIAYRDVLNSNWEKFSRTFDSYRFYNTLPMVNVSYKMIEKDAEAFYAGVGMSIIIAQKSSFGKRILALENKPTWVNLEDSDDFLSIVEKFSEIIRSQNNTCFCFERGIDMIVTALYESDFLCNKMKLVLFSNGLSGNIEKYYDYMETQFTLMNYYIPKLVLWNLSKTDICEIPGEKVMDNCILISGFSSCLIKYIATLNKDDTAYDVVSRILSGERYEMYSQYMSQLVQKSR